jgi:hypothetical protein
MKKKTKKKAKAKRNYTNTKPLALPDKYAAGYLKNLDKRTVLFETLNNAYVEILQDLGGKESLSHLQLSLVERYVFLEHILQRLELKIAKSPKKSAELLGGWVQGLNSLLGLSKTIGLKRNPKQVMNLKNYIKNEKE